MNSEDASTGTAAMVPSEPSVLSSRRRLFSLRLSIYWLVLVTLLPSFVLLAYLAKTNHELQRERVYQASAQLARKLSARLDQEFVAIESGLQILATSKHLSSGDLRSFHAQASEALRTQVAYNFILTDLQGRQLLNTLRPYGSSLPTSGTPEALQAVFREERTVLTDLFEGPLVNKPVIAMGVPVRVNGEIRYSLNVGLEPMVFNRLLAQEQLPRDWLTVILDSSATIVARSRSPEVFLGQKAVPALVEAIQSFPEATIETVTKEGIPAVSSHYRASLWNWTVAVGVNKTLLESDLQSRLFWMFAGGVLTLGLGLSLAYILSNRVLKTIGKLNEAARALGQGRALQLPGVGFLETEAVSDALVQASRVMLQVQHKAYHDPLTGLANRALFTEIALKQLSAARREQTGLAVLAIDLDEFKTVNDQLGHHVGDLLLQQVAYRLTAHIRNSDLAARQGGDEFLVLMAGADQALAVELAKRLVAALSEPYPGVHIKVSASVGIATYPISADNIDDLLLQADSALYEAKRSGKSRHAIFTSPD